MEILKDQLAGRQKIKTNLSLVGDPSSDLSTIKKILKQALNTHSLNVAEFNKLFQIYFNSKEYWSKTKQQRTDINNIISVPNAWAITRTLTGYCFGEPIKYVARQESELNQPQVETLSAWLDFCGNHNATFMAATTASICGLGYKLALQNKEAEADIPFNINNDIIYPQNAFVVYSNKAIAEPVMAVFIGEHFDSDGKAQTTPHYTVWTKWHIYSLIKDGEDFKALGQEWLGGNTVVAYPRSTDKTPRRLPLIEIENNAFRKGDWEVAIDLLKLKNQLISNRADDIQQVVDYILVLMNCKFETEDDRKEAIQARILELDVKDTNNKPSIEILKNALDQNGVQIYADYIDLLIQECVGIPNRQERGGGGGDTGKAVIHRNGFRDLENNAGFKIPKMDKAELDFLAVCLDYCKYADTAVKELKAYNIRNKFVRSLTDDIVSSSLAYRNYREGGMNDKDSIIASRSATDPSEVAKNNSDAYNAENLLFQMQEKAKAPMPKPNTNGDNNGE